MGAVARGDIRSGLPRDGSRSVDTSVMGVAAFFVSAIMRIEDRRVDPVVTL